MSETLPAIITRLGRAGWGELAPRSAQGCRAVLEGLARVLPAGDAAGLTTAYQVAQAAGRCERRTRDILSQLETMGVIVWYRGGIDDGKPVASWIRVCKARLWAMIPSARRAQDAARARRAAETRRRIRETLRYTSQSGRKTVPGRYRALSTHADITPTLPPSGRDSRRAIPSPSNQSPATERIDDMRRAEYRPTCEHGVPADPMACPLCRAIMRRSPHITPASLLVVKPPTDEQLRPPPDLRARWARALAQAQGLVPTQEVLL